MKNKQTQLELSTSINALDALISAVVKASDLTPMLVKWNEYLTKLAGTESSHKDFHIELLNAVDPTKGLQTILRTLLKESVTNSSYLDRNVIASKIGKKLLPKNVKGTPMNKASVSLSLGLNLVNIAAYCNIVSYKVLIGKDKHTISTLVLNPNVANQAVSELALQIRATNFMVCQPKPHTSTATGGLLTQSKTMLNSSGFNSVSTQSEQVCEAVNALQDVSYSVRTNLTTEIVNQYKLADKWYNQSGQFQTREWSKFVNDLTLAKEVGSIYFPIAMDDRGRMYEISSYIKYQGDSFQKAMLEFSTKQYCTDEGLTMLAIAVANELYSDKVEFNDAVAWIESKSDEELLELSHNNPLAEMLVRDYIDAQDGKPIGTITHWDATNSGLQIYSLLGADRQTASLCNVFDTGIIADAYKALADALNDVTGSNAFNRSNVKNAFMVFLYGSMAKNILFCIEDKKNGVLHGIAEFFPLNWDADMMWEAFTTAMDKIAPAAIRLMNLIYSYNTDGRTKFCWLLLDGCKVETTSTISYSGTQPEDKNQQVRGWFLDLNGKTHEGHSSVILEEYNKFSRSLAPNIIHSIDAYLGREVIRRCKALGIEVSFIHDSFGVHPNNALALQQIVREVGAHILELDLLTNILTQIDSNQTEWNIKKGNLTRGTLTTADVLNSAYMVR